MTLRFMLDTNIVSDMLRNPDGNAVRVGRGHGEDSLCVSAIVACELRFGARKRGSAVLARRIEDFLVEVPPLAFEPDCSFAFAEIRGALESAGTPVGPFDMLIAAHALTLELALVTDNVREFSRIDGLRIENWMDVRS
jgi:tRNA(fMet)-specific endonuclease VapC